MECVQFRRTQDKRLSGNFGYATFLSINVLRVARTDVNEDRTLDYVSSKWTV